MDKVYRHHGLLIRLQTVMPLCWQGEANHVGFLFDFDLHPDAGKRATFSVRFSDDADLHWQLDRELHLRKLDDRSPW